MAGKLKPSDRLRTDRLTPEQLRQVAPDVLRRTTVADNLSLDEFKINLAWLSASDSLVEEVIQSEGWRLELTPSQITVSPAAVRYFPDPCFMVGPGVRAIVHALQGASDSPARSFHEDPALFEVIETLMLCQDVVPDHAFARIRSLRRVWGFFTRWSRPMAASPIPYLSSRNAAPLVKSSLRESSEWCYAPALRASRSRAATVARFQFDLETRQKHWSRHRAPAPFIDEDPHDPVGVLRLAHFAYEEASVKLIREAQATLATPVPRHRLPDGAPHSLKREAGHPPTVVADQTDAAALDRKSELEIRRELRQRSRRGK